jgi:hypothetical protein
MQTANQEKSSPKMFAIYESFNELLKLNDHPLGENSANLVTLERRLEDGKVLSIHVRVMRIGQ